MLKNTLHRVYQKGHVEFGFFTESKNISNFQVGTEFLGQNSQKEKKKRDFWNIGKMKNWVSIFYRRMKNTILRTKNVTSHNFLTFPDNFTG